MLGSARRLAAAGADFLICPDNTIHQAFGDVVEESPVPWLHIADVVAIQAWTSGFRRLGIMGTRWLVQSEVYPDTLGAHGMAAVGAEASDVANAIFDGADAVMLSAETSVGEHPVAAVEMMERITAAAEVEMEKSPWKPMHAVARVSDFADAICDAATLVAAEVGAKYIVAFTQSGSTAQLLSKYRPPVPLIAFTPYPAVRNRLAVYERQTAPVLAWYEQHGTPIATVNAVGPVDDVTRRALDALRRAGVGGGEERR